MITITLSARKRQVRAQSLWMADICCIKKCMVAEYLKTHSFFESLVRVETSYANWRSHTCACGIASLLDMVQSSHTMLVMEKKGGTNWK